MVCVSRLCASKVQQGHTISRRQKAHRSGTLRRWTKQLAKMPAGASAGRQEQAGLRCSKQPKQRTRTRQRSTNTIIEHR